MAARVFKLEELATQIATHLLAINLKSTLALALTSRALEVPALKALWGLQGSFKVLITQVLTTDAYGFATSSRFDSCLLVSHLFSPNGHFACSPITKNPTGVTATAH